MLRSVCYSQHITSWHRRSQGAAEGPYPPKFLENIVILFFERRFSKQNSVIHLQSNILAPPNFWPLPNFWAGYATASWGITFFKCYVKLRTKLILRSVALNMIVNR